MYYVIGVNWEAFYNPGRYGTVKLPFPTKHEAEEACERLKKEQPEASWGVHDESFFRRGPRSDIA